MTLAAEVGPVCVIIAAKDGEQTVARAVRSALAQPEAGEVIVIDDGSTDRTAAVARAQDDGSGRLRVIVSAQNEGPAAARNRALSVSRSPLICVLDSDDFMLNGRLRRLLASEPSWDFLADNILTCRQDAEAGPFASLIEPDPAEPINLDLARFALQNISDPRRPRRELGFLKPVMRREFLDLHGLRYDPNMRLGEDYALYAEALARGARFKIVKACGYVAVERSNSLSGAHRAADVIGILQADDRLLDRADLRSEARAAVMEHRRSVRLNADFRQMLDAKHSGRWDGVFRHLFRTPATTFYILRETAKGKWRSFQERRQPAALSSWSSEDENADAVASSKL